MTACLSLFLALLAPVYGDKPSAQAVWAWATAQTAPAAPQDQPATLVLIVPESAQVWLQGQPTTLTGRERTFVSPPLKPGEYTYTIRVKVGNDVTAKVTVKPGQTVRVEFPVIRTGSVMPSGAGASC